MAESLSLYTQQQIQYLYSTGVGTVAISRTLSIHRVTVQRWLKRNLVSLRKTSPHSHYNISYFSNYTPESCYWAGFFLADGCIRSDKDTVSLHLKGSDKDHLYKFSSAISAASGRVRTERNGSCRIDVSGMWYPKDLNQYFGITPRKSLTTTFPEQVPPEFWSSFIRGIFDGDGSVGLHSSIYGGTAMNFVGTLSLLTKLSIIFNTIVGVYLKGDHRLPRIQKKGNCCQLSYSGRNADKILSFIYEESSSETRLDRKYETWLRVRRTHFLHSQPVEKSCPNERL